jgi:hypothetical protein
MIDKLFHKLSPLNQANVVIAIGVVLLLNSLHLVKGLDYFIILISIGLIVYGVIQAEYHKKVMKLFKK